MLLNKLNLDVCKFASSDGTRPALAGVHITSTHTEATSGHVFCRVTLPAGHDGAEFPVLEGFDATSNGKACVLTTDDAVRISKAIPKSRTLPILSHAAWDAGASTDRSLRFATTDLDTVQKFEPRPVDMQYPDCDAILPKDEPMLRIRFNANLLADLVRFVAQNKYQHEVDLEFHGPDRACMVYATNADTGQKVTGLIMPLRKN